jgi:PIN domain nuclease of toxin-antitoxin system
MNVLIDTHVLIWWMENSKRLGVRTKAAIQHSETTVWVSAISVWEINTKVALGRLDVRQTLVEEIEEEMLSSGFRRLPISFEHAFALRFLPLYHRDPFDRMLVAQAQCEGLTLITADEVIAAYGVPTLDAAT